MDLFDLLVGGDSPDSKLIAEQLRRQNTLGLVGAATGDKGLASAGQMVTNQSTDMAAQIAKQRADAQQATALERWRQTQTDTSRQNNLTSTDVRMAGIQAQMDRLGAKADNDRQLAELKAQLGGDKASEAATTKQEALNAKAAAQLSAKTVSSSIPELRTSIVRMNDLISKYGNELPGIGGLKNSVLGSALLSDEGKQVRSTATAILNDLLKAYSGAAVSDQESRRRLTEQAQTMFDSKENFLNMWGLMVDRYNNKKNSVRGGYSPEVQTLFNDNGGMSLEDIVSASTGKLSDVKSRTSVSDDSSPDPSKWSPEKRKRYEVYKAGKK